MSKLSYLVRVSMLVALAVISAVVPASAAHIQLDSLPTPPGKALNDGTGTIQFDWTIEVDTNCCQPYLFDVLDPSLTPIPEFVPPISFACVPSPLINMYIWHVPAGQPCGGYHGRIRFFSDWQGPATCTLQDEAIVSCLIGAGAGFKICKFLDINHNGVKDPGEPPIQGWQFNVEHCDGGVITTATTGVDGCASVVVEVNCTGTTQLCIRDVLPPGWVQTTQGGVNPFPVTLVPGQNPDVLVGNWQPILICGSKYLDQAPWPWTSPHFVGPDGQQNPSDLEPVPPCPQPAPPASCTSPPQQDAALGIVPVGIPGVTVSLFDNGNLLATTVTGPDGSFCFGPLQWRPSFRIVMSDPAPAPPTCNPPIADVPPPLGPFSPWAGTYYGTVATSPWPCRIVNFATPHVLNITIPAPVQPNQVYGCNYFFNRQPSRLFGKFCDLARQLIPSISLAVEKDGFPYIPDTLPVAGDGYYQVPPLAVEPQGLRQGTFRLTPPPVPDVLTQSWEVTTYCDSIHGSSTFNIGPTGFVDVGVGHSSDVRVDFCIVEQPNRRQCFQPVTFTQQGWHNFCDPANPIITGGMVYNRFPTAFASFSYFSTIYVNKVIIGQGKTLTWEGTSAGLKRLCLFLPQTGPCGKLDTSYLNPWSLPNGVGGALAGELLALQMNIAYNDRRLMPRTAGYDLELFKIAGGLFKGKTVREVRNIANSVLGGASPASFGLPNCQALVDILAAVNGNYEFVNFDIFTDNGFLIPNVVFGQSGPPIPVVVP